MTDNRQYEPPRERTRRQIFGLDLIRFLSALLVVGYHMGFVAGAPSNPARELMPATQPLLGSPPTFWFGFIGVQIFFVISGFVIAYSAERSNAVGFLRDRIVRLGPALWICATFSLMLFYIFSSSDLLTLASSYLREVAFYPMPPWLSPVVWTLGVEIVFYALVFTLLLIKRFEWLEALAACLACVSLAFHLFVWSLDCGVAAQSGVCSQLASNARLVQLALLKHGCFFALGIFLWLWLVKGRVAFGIWWAYVALAACIVQIVNKVAQQEQIGAHTGYRGELSELVAIAVWLAAIFAITTSVRFNGKLASVLGDRLGHFIRLVGLSTYPLYLIHYVSIGVIIWVLAQLGWSLEFVVWISAGAAIALSFLVAGALEPPLQAVVRRLLNSVITAFSAQGLTPALLRKRPRR